MKRRQLGLLTGILLTAFLCQCGKEEAPQTASAPGSPAPLTEEQRLARMVESEEWILARTPELKALGKGLIKDRQLPNKDNLKRFAKQLTWNEARGSSSSKGILTENSLFMAGGETRDEETVPGLLWNEPLANVATFERAKFYFVSAKQKDREGQVMEAEVGFEGIAELSDGRWRSLRGSQTLTFSLSPSNQWEIIHWRQSALKCYESEQRFFKDTLKESLAEPSDYQRARFSYHEDNLIKLFSTGKFTTTDPVYARYQDLESSHQHPGLAVVDIDNDGWDELYVMGRWGKNQLFQRRALDGRFVDVAPQYGLDLEGYCNGAIFADFDNDGDPDAFIARSLKRCLYLENVDGRFTDASKSKVAVPLPFLTSSISAADYNNDGYLDVYLGLYGPTSKESPVSVWAKEFFPPAMAKALIEREKNSHRYLDMLGPPNLLLENRRGRFVVSAAAGPLAEWRNTYQSTWTDYDNDGDVDLHVCNDFAPDAFFRNEGGKRFTEVSEEVSGKAMMGFGMGASWEDFDQDGHLDLFVSNMFSKAGRRITSQIDGLDERVVYSAQGSLLLKNDGTKFQQLAGMGNNDLNVAKVGWSFGGLFFDADNDGFPDIYSASGYYTAPEVTRSDQDL